MRNSDPLTFKGIIQKKHFSQGLQDKDNMREKWQNLVGAEHSTELRQTCSEKKANDPTAIQLPPTSVHFGFIQRRSTLFRGQMAMGTRYRSTIFKSALFYLEPPWDIRIGNKNNKDHSVPYTFPSGILQLVAPNPRMKRYLLIQNNVCQDRNSKAFISLTSQAWYF